MFFQPIKCKVTLNFPALYHIDPINQLTAFDISTIKVVKLGRFARIGKSHARFL
jgi:hypothetical protein